MSIMKIYCDQLLAFVIFGEDFVTGECFESCVTKVAGGERREDLSLGKF